MLRLAEQLCCRSCRGLPDCTPSLADLASQVLGQSLRPPGQPHDCERDAAAAVALALSALQHGAKMDLQPPEIKVCVWGACNALLHEAGL